MMIKSEGRSGQACTIQKDRLEIIQNFSLINLIWLEITNIDGRTILKKIFRELSIRDGQNAEIYTNSITDFNYIALDM